MNNQGKLGRIWMNEHVTILNKGRLAETLFQSLDDLFRERYSASIEQQPLDIPKAEEEMVQLEQKLGRKLSYTTVAWAKVHREKEIANIMEAEFAEAFDRQNIYHDAVVRNAVKTQLKDILIKEGRARRKLGIVELVARLLPALNAFSGASDYFIGGYIPYGVESREPFGESRYATLVTQEVAAGSAHNLCKSLHVYYALAESSAGPTTEVPKSGKQPRVYIAAFVNGGSFVNREVIIPTHFRAKFDAVVREEMFTTLREMYAHDK